MSTSSSHSFESPLPRAPLRERLGRAWKRARRRAQPPAEAPRVELSPPPADLASAPVAQLKAARERATVYDRRLLMAALEGELARGEGFDVETDEITAEHLRDLDD